MPMSGVPTLQLERAGLNCISHPLLHPQRRAEPPVNLPERARHADYNREPAPAEMDMPEVC